MTKLSLIKLLTVLVFCISVLILPQMATAKAELVPIEGVSYQANASMQDNLKTLIGKKVYVHLDSGTTLSGYLKTVGNHMIHLERLDRKDFYDALIKIDKIVAIDTQFRKYK